MQAQTRQLKPPGEILQFFMQHTAHQGLVSLVAT